MAINIYHSRRKNYKKCIYWIGEDIRDMNEWILKNDPTGLFYAREIIPESTQGNEVQNVLLVNRKNATLKTTDNIDDLKQGCIVQYKNFLWMVTNVQGTEVLKETEYSDDSTRTFVVALRR